MVVGVTPADYCDPVLTDREMPAETNNGGGGGGGAPRASLLCRPNSHPFQDRMLSLDQPVKVGRSVARARPVQTNAIFDCKVLSRNHALLWYENGKFYLQDTKSSNGTFVNNQRLSKGSEESPAREVCSGDILQFGVDVMENSRKVTHGCIIATLKLYLPDGKEAKASPSIVNTSPGTAIPAQDLYQLNQYIQEALAREQLLENKLLSLQRLIAETEGASTQGWKALMDEDRLTRVEILESQLTTYGKNMTEDKLREETKRLMEEKESYQNTAKDTLKKVVDEKLESCKKLKEVEQALHNLEEEYTSLRKLYDRVVDENKKLSEKITTLSEDLIKKTKDETSEMNELNESQNDINDAIIKKSELFIENDSYSENGDIVVTETNGKYCEDDSDFDKTDNDMAGSTDSLDGSVPEEAENTDPTKLAKLLEDSSRLRGLVEDLNKSKVKTDYELVNLRINLEEAKNENATILQELENTRNKLVDAEKLIESQDKLVRDLEEKIHENTFRESTDIISSAEDPAATPVPRPTSHVSAIGSLATPTDPPDQVAAITEECKALQDKVKKLEKENLALQAQCQAKSEDQLSAPALGNIMQSVEPASPLASSPARAELTMSSVLNLSGSSCSDISQLELSLEEAEEKIAGLLRVKEKLVLVQAEKSQLEVDVSQLEDELSTLAVASRSLTACTVIPIIVLLVAIVTAFLPLISSAVGTRDF
jgi:pSer/pThr/pTyr-binding forkhead associated (FHA) protein